MTKQGFTVMVAWLSAAAWVAAQAPGNPPPPVATPATTQSAQAAPPAEHPAQHHLPATPEAPPEFVPALPCVAPPLPPPPPPPTLSGIIAEPERRPMAWIDADYLHWWIKKGPIVPLVTTGSATAVNPGALADPTTVVLFGSSNLDYGGFSGGQVRAGAWLNYDQNVGFEASGFLLEQKTIAFRAASNENGNPLLAQPFIDVNQALNLLDPVAPIAIPDFLNGSIQINSQARLGGAEANLFAPFTCCPELTIDFMAGFRYFDLSENLTTASTTGITTSAVAVAAAAGGQFFQFFNGLAQVPFPQQLAIMDSFKTRNSFYGGQVGFRSQWSYERLYLKVQAEVAVGTVRQAIDVAGSTMVLDNVGGNVVAQAQGGIYALPSNSGHFVTSRFGVLPSAEIKAGFELFPGVGLELGFSVLYLTSVVRPGSVIDQNVNLGQIPSSTLFGTNLTPVAPLVRTNPTSFWAEGITIGLCLSY